MAYGIESVIEPLQARREHDRGTPQCEEEAQQSNPVMRGSCGLQFIFFNGSNFHQVP
jgi:hypothetical protein